MPKGLRAMADLVVLRNQVIQPLLAATQELRPSRGGESHSAGYALRYDSHGHARCVSRARVGR
jgi:hypothetical protein